MVREWFSKIDTAEEARKFAKQGAIGVLLFALMNLLGVIFVYYAGTSPVEKGAPVDSDGVQDYIIGAVVVLPLLLFFAYRVYTGKGWLVAAVTLVWFLAEVGMKVAGGSTNVGWILFYAGVAGMLYNGLRACWWLRKNGKADHRPDPIVQ